MSGNDALLESLKPMLVEQGWLEAGPVDEQSERLQTPAIYLRTPTYAFRIGDDSTATAASPAKMSRCWKACGHCSLSAVGWKKNR